MSVGCGPHSKATARFQDKWELSPSRDPHRTETKRRQRKPTARRAISVDCSNKSRDAMQIDKRNQHWTYAAIQRTLKWCDYDWQPN